MAKGKPPKPGNAPDGDDAEKETTALIVDVALREGSLLARRAVHRKLAGGDLTDLKKGGRPRASVTKRITAAALARLAARSIPGTLVVAGGLVARAVLLRRKHRRDAE